MFDRDVSEQTQPYDPSPMENIPVAETTPSRDTIDAYSKRGHRVLSATTMLLFGDSSFGSVCV